MAIEADRDPRHRSTAKERNMADTGSGAMTEDSARGNTAREISAPRQNNIDVKPIR
jgi:hypothetical protein